MVDPNEPAHLVCVAKACPRCRFPHVKFRYFNNGKPSQPRYECLKCKNNFTLGGKIRPPKKKKDTKDKKKVVQREAAVVAGASEARTHLTSATSSTSTLRDVKPEAQFVMDLWSTSSRTVDHSLFPVSPACKGKRSRRGIRTTRNIFELQRTPAVLQKQDEDMEIYDMEPIVELDWYGAGSLWPNFEGDLWSASKFEEMHGSELVVWEPELELIDYAGAEPAAAGVPVDEIEALVDRGPALSSDWLRRPIVRCGGSSASSYWNQRSACE